MDLVISLIGPVLGTPVTEIYRRITSFSGKFIHTYLLYKVELYKECT